MVDGLGNEEWAKLLDNFLIPELWSYGVHCEYGSLSFKLSSWFEFYGDGDKKIKNFNEVVWIE